MCHFNHQICARNIATEPMLSVTSNLLNRCFQNLGFLTVQIIKHNRIPEKIFTLRGHFPKSRSMTQSILLQMFWTFSLPDHVSRHLHAPFHLLNSFYVQQSLWLFGTAALLTLPQFGIPNTSLLILSVVWWASSWLHNQVLIVRLLKSTATCSKLHYILSQCNKLFTTIPTLTFCTICTIASPLKIYISMCTVFQLDDTTYQKEDSRQDAYTSRTQQHVNQL